MCVSLLQPWNTINSIFTSFQNKCACLILPLSFAVIFPFCITWIQSAKADLFYVLEALRTAKNYLEDTQRRCRRSTPVGVQVSTVGFLQQYN